MAVVTLAEHMQNVGLGVQYGEQPLTDAFGAHVVHYTFKDAFLQAPADLAEGVGEFASAFVVGDVIGDHHDHVRHRIGS